MAATYRLRGGAAVGAGMLLAHNVSWPFAVLELGADEVTLQMHPIAPIHIPLKQIDRVKRVGRVPIVWQGLRIDHHSDAPRHIYFWCVHSREELVAQFLEYGVQVT
jgi:hypothetical protein